MVPSVSPPSSANLKRPILLGIALMVITLATFSPLFHGQFSNWDDNTNLSGNPHIMSRTLEGLGYFWKRPFLGLYIPVTYTEWWILVAAQPEANSDTLNAAPFHIANVLTHGATVLVVFAILRLLVKNDWAAAGGALLFAVHPLQTEAVGWVCGAKDLLASLFGFSAVWCYLWHLQHRRQSGGGRRRSIYFAAGTFALIFAVLSKPGAMCMPLIAAAIAIFALQRRVRLVLLELLPWFCIVAGTAIVARIVQPPREAQLVSPLWARPVIAGDSLAFYLCKLFLPVRLTLDYGRTFQVTLHQFPYPAYWNWVFPAGVIAFVWLNRKRWPLVLAGTAVFIAGLLPMLGFASFDYEHYSNVADHYTYPAMLGPALAVAGLFAMAKRAALVATVATPVFAVLAVLTFAQARTWLNDQTIFTHQFEVKPDDWLAINHFWLGAMLRKDYAGGEAEARAFIKVSPDNSMAWFDLGEALVYQNRREEAVKAYKEGIRLDPSLPPAYNDLGALYAEEGRYDLAIPFYEHALRLNPDYGDAREGLARARAEAATRASALPNGGEH